MARVPMTASAYVAFANAMVLPFVYCGKQEGSG